MNKGDLYIVSCTAQPLRERAEVADIVGDVDTLAGVTALVVEGGGMYLVLMPFILSSVLCFTLLAKARLISEYLQVREILI